MRTRRGLIRYLEEAANHPDEQLANQRGEITAAQSQAIEDHIVACLQPAPGDRILELGCGTGMIARAMLARDAWVVLVDVAHNMLLRAYRSTPNPRAVQASCTALPFREDSFDNVTFNNAIAYLSADEVLLTLRELRRVVRTGGTIFVGDISDPRHEAQLFTNEGAEGWGLRARLAYSRAKELVRPWIGVIWRSRRRHRGWYTPAEFLDVLNDLEMRGRICTQGPEMPYHPWRYDCLVRVEK